MARTATRSTTCFRPLVPMALSVATGIWLDVPRALEEALEQYARIAEGGLGFALRGRDRRGERDDIAEASVDGGGAVGLRDGHCDRAGFERLGKVDRRRSRGVGRRDRGLEARLVGLDAQVHRCAYAPPCIVCAPMALSHLGSGPVRIPVRKRTILPPISRTDPSSGPCPYDRR